MSHLEESNRRFLTSFSLGCEQCCPRDSIDGSLLAPSPIHPSGARSIDGRLTDFYNGCERCRMLFDGVMHFALMIDPQATPRNTYVICDPWQSDGICKSWAEPYPKMADFPSEISFYFGDKPHMRSLSIRVTHTRDHIKPWSSVEAQTEISLKVIDMWIKRCDSEHGQECTSRSRGFVPSRLLDLSGGVIRLLESEEIAMQATTGSAPIYVALSHCWGREPTFVTTLSNVADLKLGLADSDLPKTFRDAIMVTRRLGQRFLWIDSLCIIQDSQEDWEIESGRMGSIYEQAYLTIAATHSPDGNGGCFNAVHKAPYVWPQQHVNDESRPSERRGVVLVTHEHLWKSARFTSRRLNRWMNLRPSYNVRQLSSNAALTETIEGAFPLLKRAWFLQERLLSSRVLHFGPVELFWECRCAFWDECFGSEPQPPIKRQPFVDIFGRRIEGVSIQKEEIELLTPKPRELFNALMNSSKAQRSPDAGSVAVNPWYELIEEYSKMDLTKEMDRLPALSGIASFCGGEGYLAGIWANQLPESLLWATIPSDISIVRRPHDYRAPSFSWVSVEGPVKYRRGLTGKSQERDFIAGERVGYAKATVLGYESVAQGLDPRGRVKAGFIELHGWTGTAKVSDITQRRSETICVLQQADRAQSFQLDVPLCLCRSEPAEVQVGDDIHMLLLECEKIPTSNLYRRSYRAMALVLRPSKEITGAFQRVGLIFPADNLGLYISDSHDALAGADVGIKSSMFDEAPKWFPEKKAIRLV